MPKNIPPSSRRRLRSTVQMEIRRLRQQAKLLDKLDHEVWAAGRTCFRTDYALARWLVSPDSALNGVTPMTVLSGNSGRAKVLNLLWATTHGVVL